MEVVLDQTLESACYNKNKHRIRHDRKDSEEVVRTKKLLTSFQERDHSGNAAADTGKEWWLAVHW